MIVRSVLPHLECGTICLPTSSLQRPSPHSNSVWRFFCSHNRSTSDELLHLLLPVLEAWVYGRLNTGVIIIIIIIIIIRQLHISTVKLSECYIRLFVINSQLFCKKILDSVKAFERYKQKHFWLIFGPRVNPKNPIYCYQYAISSRTAFHRR